jgi:hypothetical protein
MAPAPLRASHFRLGDAVPRRLLESVDDHLSEETSEGGRGYINHLASYALCCVAIHAGDAAGMSNLCATGGPSSASSVTCTPGPDGRQKR